MGVADMAMRPFYGIMAISHMVNEFNCPVSKVKKKYSFSVYKLKKLDTSEVLLIMSSTLLS